MGSAVAADSAPKNEMDRLRDADFLAWPVAAGWEHSVRDFSASEQGRELAGFLRRRLASGACIYPPEPFRALRLTALADVHMVIVGQDPYHGPGQAEGLAFSVGAGMRLPPSLRNIFRELDGTAAPLRPGSLQEWARQGVLLLNTCLTVEEGRAASHARKGWEALTDALLAATAARASPCAYLLWGAHAHAKAPAIERTAAENGCEVLVLRANHPSPLSARRPPIPFLGSGHFRQALAWLAARGCRLEL